MKIKITNLISFVLAGFICTSPVHGDLLEGTVLDDQGNPLANAEISLLNQTTTTNVEGQFLFENFPRQNGLLQVKRQGYHSELIPVYLFYAESIVREQIEPILLAPNPVNEIRFLFGGDTSFGRRYLDPKEVTLRDQLPKDDPNALILASQPLPGSQYVGSYIRPYYQEADWGVLNLETALTRDPSTPHWEKDYAYFTLPESAPVLHWLGVDYVSLGNNHLYDYLDIGVADTIATLDAINMPHSGAGMNSDEAFQAYRTMIKETPYAFLSMNGVSGSKHSISYVADENHGGAADLRDKEQVEYAIERELEASYIPIVQLHGGKEYTYEPTAPIQRDIEHAVESGAKLVVGHHPHVAQGIGKKDGIVTIHSLGNLIFDQARLETMLGLLARVDMQGETVKAVRFLPVYVEDYIPKPISGRLADVFLRRIGEFSLNYDALVYPYNNQGWVVFEDEETQAQAMDRTLELDVDIPVSGMTVVDLRMLAKSSESLLKAYSNSPDLSVRLGRDVLIYGDFEDWDLDDDILEASRWDTTGASNSICALAYSGVAALCSRRNSSNKSDSVTAFRNRTRIMGESTGTPNKDLSLFGYVYGNNAGALKIITRYYSSVGDKTFGESESFSHPGGSFYWQPIIADLYIPADEAEIKDVENNPRAVRFFVRQSPPLSSDGLAVFDEFAAINWENFVDVVSGEEVMTPHARDFWRIEGEPGKHHLSLTFRTYQPAASPFVSVDIKANGHDFWHIDTQTNVSFAVSLKHNSDSQQAYDWWIEAVSDFGVFYYVYPDGWVLDRQPTVSFPLFNLSPFVIFESALPQGTYRVNFCIDGEIDNKKDCTWKDSVSVYVN
jgi:hypothetical protein